jgi:riboflavin kinase / FMN adenylyltransferase
LPLIDTCEDLSAGVFNPAYAMTVPPPALPLSNPSAERYEISMQTFPKERRRFATLNGVEPVAPQHRDSVLAIGNFDGVHRGHQALLRAARDLATARHVPAGAMIFEPHPRMYFRPDLPHFMITPRDRQLHLLERFGLDQVVTLPFDRDLSQLSARAFVADILVARIGVSHVVIGYDFSFGRGRTGNADAMRTFGVEFGFGVTVVAPVGTGTVAFSSSAIRALLAQGDVAGANLVLGHRWRAIGRVVGGAKRGTGLGFPTANIAISASTRLGHGIYAAWVHVGGECHDGAAYFGTRPQFDNGDPILEVFLLDFDGNLYGQDVSVAFVEFIRSDGAFAGVEALKIQMAKDCAQVADTLAAIRARDPLASFALGAA